MECSQMPDLLCARPQESYVHMAPSRKELTLTGFKCFGLKRVLDDFYGPISSLG